MRTLNYIPILDIPLPCRNYFLESAYEICLLRFPRPMIDHVDRFRRLEERDSLRPVHAIWVRDTGNGNSSGALPINGRNSETGHYRKHHTSYRRNELTSCCQALHSYRLIETRGGGKISRAREKLTIRWIGIQLTWGDRARMTCTGGRRARGSRVDTRRID